MGMEQHNCQLECAKRPHKDANNMGPSKITAFGPFRGGRLWTKDPDGDDPCPDTGIAEVGVMHDCRAPTWIPFDGNILHCTEHFPPKDRRISLVFYTVRNLGHASGEVRRELRTYGFEFQGGTCDFALGAD